MGANYKFFSYKDQLDELFTASVRDVVLTITVPVNATQSMPFMEAAILKLIPKSNSYLRFFKRKKLKKCCFKATLLLKEKQKYLLLLFLDLIFIFVNIEFENISECAGFFFLFFFF